MVRSSAYEEMLTAGFEGVGISDMNRLNRVGDNTAPCGTPLGNIRVLDLVPPQETAACLPEMKFASHFLRFGGTSDCRILAIRRKRGTVSKALDMSIAAMRDLVAGFLLLKPSITVCVSEHSKVVVECCGRKSVLGGG